jgi:two-component system LytT family response regulator
MKCLTVDDDPLICDLIKHFCSKQKWITSCLSVSDGSQAVQAVQNDQFDLIFLDYNLPDLNGKDLLEILPASIPVIMITTEESFGAASYDYSQVIDFLLKPISYERFLKAIFRFRLRNSEGLHIAKPTLNERIIVKEGSNTVLLKTKEIRYIKSEANYVVFYLEQKKVMALMSLKKLEEDLPNDFIRIHKSYMANLNFIDAISTDHVQIGQDEIPIGLKHKENLIEIIKAIHRS